MALIIFAELLLKAVTCWGGYEEGLRLNFDINLSKLWINAATSGGNGAQTTLMNPVKL